MTTTMATATMAPVPAASMLSLLPLSAYIVHCQEHSYKHLASLTGMHFGSSFVRSARVRA